MLLTDTSPPQPVSPTVSLCGKPYLKKLQIADLATLQTRSILYLGNGLHAGISLHGHMWTIEGCFSRPTMRDRISLKSEIIGFFLTITPYLIDDGSWQWFWLFHNWLRFGVHFPRCKSQYQNIIADTVTYSVRRLCISLHSIGPKVCAYYPDICWSW